MYFTQEDYKKIEEWLRLRAVKDTEFPPAEAISGYEVFSIIQDGENRIMPIRCFLKGLCKLFNTDFEDFKSAIENKKYINSADRGSYGPYENAIILKHDAETVAAIDVSDFILDKAIDDVRFDESYENLLIVFNVDAGSKVISIPLSKIFNPDNYYTKTDVDTLVKNNAVWKRGTGSYSAVLSSECKAGNSAVAEGSSTTASGYGSHSEGVSSVASGSYGSHAEGNQTKATGDYGSHAEGESTEASGQTSHAEGARTQAKGKWSHSEGCYTVTNNNSEHASGMYNVSTPHPTDVDAFDRNEEATLFSIGNGASEERRHNALEVKQSGKILIPDIYDSASASRKPMMNLQEKLKYFQDIINNIDLSNSITIGETSGTAYDGGKGKALADKVSSLEEWENTIKTGDRPISSIEFSATDRTVGLTWNVVDPNTGSSVYGGSSSSVLPVANASQAGILEAEDYNKLAGIEKGAQVNKNNLETLMVNEAGISLNDMQTIQFKSTDSIDVSLGRDIGSSSRIIEMSLSSKYNSIDDIVKDYESTITINEDSGNYTISEEDRNLIFNGIRPRYVKATHSGPGIPGALIDEAVLGISFKIASDLVGPTQHKTAYIAALDNDGNIVRYLLSENTTKVYKKTIEFN